MWKNYVFYISCNAFVGSVQHKSKPEDIAGCLFDAINDFSAAGKQTRLREIRLVIFHKQKFMMVPIMGCLHKKTQVLAMQPKSWTSMLKGEFWCVIV